jgi:hypothetical protein
MYRVFGPLVILMSMQICLGIDLEDSLWRVITTKNSDVHRVENVDRILSLRQPLIKIMLGNSGFDIDCVRYLDDNAIRVSKTYWHGETDKILCGKLAHWCTFLRFLDLVHESGKSIGVWIEDDVQLENADIDNIISVMSQHHGKAEVRMSAGDGVVVIFDALHMMNLVKHGEITNPVDIFYSTHDVVEIGSELTSIKKNEYSSGITTTKEYPIGFVNQMIESRMAPE